MDGGDVWWQSLAGVEGGGVMKKTLSTELTWSKVHAGQAAYQVWRTSGARLLTTDDLKLALEYARFYGLPQAGLRKHINARP